MPRMPRKRRHGWQDKPWVPCACFSDYGRRTKSLKIDYFFAVFRSKATAGTQALSSSLHLGHDSDKRKNFGNRLSESNSDDSQCFIFRRPKKCFGDIFGSKISFFAKKARFLATYGQTDVKISFHVKFCFRST